MIGRRGFITGIIGRRSAFEDLPNAAALKQFRNINANAEKTHCPQGHPYNQENTRLPKRGGRRCKICDSASAARIEKKRLQNDPDYKARRWAQKKQWMRNKRAAIKAASR